MIACRARQRSEKRIAVWIIVFGTMVGAAPTRATADGVVGAKKSKVYHTHPDDCSAARNISGDNRVSFASEEEAKKEGRRLCKSCAKLDERARKKAADKSESKDSAKPKGSNPDGEEEAAADEASSVSTFDARLRKVLTGGTLLLENGDKVRIFGIVAPQSGQAHADQTVRFIEKQSKGRKVQLEALAGTEAKIRRDGLGRMLAFVTLRSGDTDVGGALIAAGLAAVDRSTESDRLDDYLKREDDAAWAGRGIWKKLDGPAGAAKVVTGKHTHEYHAADCPHVVHLIDPATITINEAKSRRLYPCEYYHAEDGGDDKEGD